MWHFYQSMQSSQTTEVLLLDSCDFVGYKTGFDGSNSLCSLNVTLPYVSSTNCQHENIPNLGFLLE